jgi:hypothetical protein
MQSINQFKGDENSVPAVGGGEGGERIVVEHGVVGGVPVLQAARGHAGQVAHAAVMGPKNK